MKDFREQINYKQVLDAMFDDLAIVDEKGILIYATEGFEKQYNVKREDVIGKSVDEIEKEKTFNPSIAKKVFEAGEQVIMSHKNKKGNYVIVIGLPVFDEDGKIEYVVSYSPTSKEITSLQQERIRLLEKLEEYQQALSELQNEFGALKEGKKLVQGSGRAIESINKIKGYDVSVLFTGESGVGKTTYAKYLHDNGTRSGGPFVEISCGAIPENLLESELFGYKKGSFTGASAEGKVGLIEMANRGTLFLDEIAELPLKLQSKLLKVLQSHKIMRVGDTKEIEVDFRLITATNKDLKQMVAEGTFREDLLYRINVITIDIPPLRKRPEDIMTMTKYFVSKFNLKYAVEKNLSPDCIKALCAYRWPGNIRELENTMEHLVIMSEGDVIRKEDLPPEILGGDYSDKKYFELGEKNLSEMMRKYEKMIYAQAVNEYRTSVDVAKVLGVSQPTAARKIREYIKESN